MYFFSAFNVSESSEVHSEENKICEEKNKKRRLKTPSQVQALEKFYNGMNFLFTCLVV